MNLERWRWGGFEGSFESASALGFESEKEWSSVLLGIVDGSIACLISC